MDSNGGLAAPLMQQRDLQAARDAYISGSVEASRAAHSIKTMRGASEEHEQSGGRLKGVIFGGLDGALTSFAILAGSVGANLVPVAMLALGVSNVLANAMSMGVGEVLSSRSYSNYVRKERDREMWELQNFPEGEINEMVELFVARGMSREDAEVVIHKMAKYKDFFVDIMMTEELALPVPSEGDSIESLKDGATMLASFAFFGLLPIVAFVVAGATAPILDTTALFACACGLTMVVLFVLGAVKAKFHDKRYCSSGCETVVLGASCAALAFLVGRALTQWTGLHELFPSASVPIAPCIAADIADVGQHV
eukprot:CAMPEP_0174727850 /NCGR_PEP_ID=MMETSP1094-20130205/50595_1 /TAXON_ID=156173 /ORGANISM="Chrysochromulina brevifilum, Strain UTEX LB 985" /LENGTH=309 /DNA_ID=CAMNT_0015929679 /DNA_START=375 /DNA_END=1304 /DNA_ORIENTATION=-